MKLHDLPLSMRITGIAMILVAMGALTLVFVEEAHLREIYFSQRRAQLDKTFRTNELRLTQTFDTLRRDVQFLANTPPVSGIIRAAQNHGYDARDGNTQQQWEARLQQIFAPFLLTRPDHLQLRYIGVADQGREIMRFSRHDGQVEPASSGRTMSMAERNDYAATLCLAPGLVHLSEFTLHRKSDKSKQPGFPIIRASVPVFEARKKVFGLIVIDMDIRPLLQSTAAGLPEDVSTCIADRHGRCLSYPNALAPVKVGNGEEMHRDFPRLVTMLDPRSPNFMPLQMMKTKNDVQYVTAGRIHYNPDNPAQFLLLTYHVSDKMAQQFTAIPVGHIIAGFAALLLLCGAVLFLLRQTFSPLKQLTAAATAITEGNHNIRLPSDIGGEIGTLTDSFAAMLDELSRREQEIIRINQGLERQIVGRTHELTAVNNRLVDEIRERERILHEVENLLQRNQALMQTAMDGIHLLDMQGNLVEANPAFCRMLGYSEAETAGLNVADWDAKWTKEELPPKFKELIGRSILIETVHRRKDGTTFDVEIACSGLEIAGQGYIYAASRDITERKQAALALQHQQELLKNAERLGKLGSWELDVPSNVLLWSDEVYRIFELDPAEFSPSYESFLRVLHPEDRKKVDRAYQRSLQNQRPYNIEHRLLFADGRVKWVREHCTSTFDVSGRPLRSVGMVQDINEMKQAEEEIRALALHDQLTGLPNRRFFLERLRTALSASVRHDDYGALLFIDMDNLKTLNDTKGHEAGDRMLLEVAERLRSCIRNIDTAFRFGGDEFVVLIEELGNDRDDALRGAGLVAEKIRESLERTYKINNRAHHSSSSIGVTLYHGIGESVDALLQHADTAMYQAKNSGRNKVCFFDPATQPAT